MKHFNTILAIVLLACFMVTPLRSQTATQQTVSASKTPDILTLESATELFLKRNLSLEAARLEINVAEAEKIGARLRPRPGVTISAENLQLTGPTPFNRLYETGLTVTQPFELGGQQKLRMELADRTVKVAEAQLTNVLRARLFELKRTYYEALLANELLIIEEETRAGFTELLRFNTVRFQEGYIAEGEVIKVRLERIKFDSAVANSSLSLKQAKIRLLEMLGESDFACLESLEVRGVLRFEEFPLDLTMIRENALNNRTDIKVLEAALVLTEVSVKLERARGKGEVVPYVGYKRVGVDNAVLAGVTVPLPFGNRNQGGIARAEAEQRVAEANLRIVCNRAIAEVESMYRAYETAREQVRAYEVGILKQADESRDISLFSYREGVAELITLLDAQRTRTEIRANYYRALMAYYTSLFQLELATGTNITR